MVNKEISDTFLDLSTPLLADACLRLGLPLRVAPPGIGSSAPGSRIAGQCLPARHYGSVDIFLEAMERGKMGDVLVVDNGGRLDEGCVGNLTALEAQVCGLAGILIWGVHRDSLELLEVGIPVFSYGTYPAGPRRLEPREPDALRRASFGNVVAGPEDFAFADSDGVLFVSGGQVEELLATARLIRDKEREQVEALRAGKTLREQFQFSDYLVRRLEDPRYTFRQHLRALGGAVEE